MLIALVLACPLPALAREQIVSPALPGFEVGYQAANSEQSILEEVPLGETVEAWTAMVTSSWFAVAHPDLDRFTSAFLGGLRESCPAATYSPPENFNHSGHPAVMFTADCPRSPATGAREQMTVLAISGDEALHVKQVAFRAGHTGDKSWAREFLLGSVVCSGDC